MSSRVGGREVLEVARDFLSRETGDGFVCVHSQVHRRPPEKRVLIIVKQA
jgi:hypothetical protein